MNIDSTESGNLPGSTEKKSTQRHSVTPPNETKGIEKKVSLW